jgi:hypothetical protein
MPRGNEEGAMNVYVVQQIVAIAPTIDGYQMECPPIAEFVGVFSTKEKAEQACRDFTYCVTGPLPMDVAAPHETTEPTCPVWFPIARTEVDRQLPGEDAD